MHAACFVTECGLAALLTVIHKSDEQQRSSAYRMQVKIMELERRLRESAQP